MEFSKYTECMGYPSGILSSRKVFEIKVLQFSLFFEKHLHHKSPKYAQ